MEALFAAASDEIDLRNKAILELSNTVEVILLVFFSLTNFRSCKLKISN